MGTVQPTDLDRAPAALGIATGRAYAVDERHGGWLVIDA
jgi:hypothetical protein